jgi:uncharacterized protein
MVASRAGHIKVVQWLLDEGAAINENDDFGLTALALACSLGHPSVVTLLLKRGARLF